MVEALGLDCCWVDEVSDRSRLPIGRGASAGVARPHDQGEPRSVVRPRRRPSNQAWELVEKTSLQGIVSVGKLGVGDTLTKAKSRDLNHATPTVARLEGPTPSVGLVAADWARPIVHVEIEAIDPEAQRAFYSALFNWAIGDAPIMSFNAGLGAPEGGPAGHIRQGTTSRITLYIQVADLVAALAKTRDLGGAVIFERLDVPGGPTLAAITDPEGNPITLVQQ